MSINFLSNKKIFISKKLDILLHKYLNNICGCHEIIDIPTIQTFPLSSYAEFDHLLSRFNDFNYLIFTSTNAVDYFIKRKKEIKIDLDYSSTKIIAVGEKTASACAEAGIPVDIIPSDFSAEGILIELKDVDIRDSKIFIPGSKLSGDKLGKGLQLKNAKVFQLPIYDIDLPDDKLTLSKLKKVIKDKADIYIFTSPSSFNNYLKLADIFGYSQYFGQSFVVAIGPTTKQAIENNHFKVDFVPSKYTVQDIFYELAEFIKN